MQSAIQEAADFLRFHSEWEDDDCRKAFGVLERLVAEFECLDWRECLEMYRSATRVVLEPVDVELIGRDLEGFGFTRSLIQDRLEERSIPSDTSAWSTVARRLQRRFEDDAAAHAEIEALFEEVDQQATATRKVAIQDYISAAFEDESWVIETIATIAAMKESEAS